MTPSVHSIRRGVDPAGSEVLRRRQYGAEVDGSTSLESVRLPAGVELTRTTPEFTASSVPAGLLAAHQVADGVWGRLRVRGGTVVYVVEDTGQRRTIVAGEAQVIEPRVRHHVEPDADARFVVEFHR